MEVCARVYIPDWLLIVLEFSQIAFWKVKNSRHSRPVSQTLIVARTDLPLKILKDKSGNPGACELIGWVKVSRPETVLLLRSF